MFYKCLAGLISDVDYKQQRKSGHVSRFILEATSGHEKAAARQLGGSGSEQDNGSAAEADEGAD